MYNLLKESRRYWKLKKEALDCTSWRTGFGISYGPALRQIYGMNE
jgi:hypothetical protein